MKGKQNLEDKKKEKQNAQSEKYYKNKKADFSYLNQFGYHVYKELGRGGYGVVYKACHMRNGIKDNKQKFAIKMNFMTVTPELIYSEIAFLCLVKGKPNLPQLEDLFIVNDKIHIVLRYFKYKPFISFFSEFQMNDIKYYLYELLKAIKELKELGIYHRDVKPGNFLYNPDTREGNLIDFGLSELDSNFVQKFKQSIQIEKDKHKKDELQKKLEYYNNIMKCIKIVGNNKIGTESFMPLESILRYQTQSYSVDMWPVGVIFLQFVLRKYNIFNNVRMMNKPADLKNNYFITFIMELCNIYGSTAVVKQCEKYGYKVSFPSDMNQDPVKLSEIVKVDGFNSEAEDLLQKLLALDQQERITVEKALDHPFFKNVKEEQIQFKQNLKNQQQQQMQQQQQQQQHSIQINQDIQDTQNQNNVLNDFQFQNNNLQFDNNIDNQLFIENNLDQQQQLLQQQQIFQITSNNNNNQNNNANNLNNSGNLMQNDRYNFQNNINNINLVQQQNINPNNNNTNTNNNNSQFM